MGEKGIKALSAKQLGSSWWFQPQLGSSSPRFGVKIKIFELPPPSDDCDDLCGY